MQKTRAVVHQSDVPAFLDVLQQSGSMEFVPVEKNEGPVASTHENLLASRVSSAVSFLGQYTKKTSLMDLLRNGSRTDMTEKQVRDLTQNHTQVTAAVSRTEQLQQEHKAAAESIRAHDAHISMLQEWQSVPNRLQDMRTESTESFLVQAPQTEKRNMDVVLQPLADSEASVAVYGPQKALVTVSMGDADAVLGVISDLKCTVVAQPEGVESPAVELTAAQESRAALKTELSLLEEQITALAAEEFSALQICNEVYSWEQEQQVASAEAGATEQTKVFSGWIMSDELSAVQAELGRRDVAAVFESIEPKEGEEPPVEIKNSALVQPFEAVTRLYGMPGHTDLDPTVFLAGFFFLFFGLSLTDVGYGATLAVIAGGLLLFAKLADGVRSMLKLLLLIGISTVLVGMLFGGYFGIAPEYLPEWMRAIQLFDPIGNPLPVFYLALGLGVFQVMVGMILKIYSDSRNGKLSDGIWEQGPWLFLFGVGIAYVADMAGILSVSTDVTLKSAYLGLGLLVLGALRQSTGVLSAVMNVFGSLYASVGFLSDILSYSRLLALGLATTALAFAVNLIAGIVYESNPYVGPLFAFFILVIGHVFTLAVNTLGAFIHSARLQFVEFFGKFVAGSGRSFAPLRRSEKHVTVIKE